jgi:molecular chaperone DnaJ
MSKRDYYEVLGVGKDASADEIKKAFRKKAGEFHPDRHPGLDEAGRKAMEEKFKEVGEAYAVLSDAEKRQRYDRFGHQAPGGGGGGFDPFAGGVDFNDVFGEGLGDLFGSFFGGGQRRRGGADLRAQLVLDFKDAVFGKDSVLEVPAQRRCQTCHGSGAKPGSKPVSCRQCNGQGRVRVNQGFMNMVMACPSCQGRGTVISDPCGTCRGQGTTRQTRSVKVSVPAGVEDGMQVRLRGEGEGGREGEPDGDLYVVLRVKEHPIFERDGETLSCELPISFATAALGGEAAVELLEGGEAVVKVPAGTQPGKVLRVRGKGVPVLNGEGRGDLELHVTVAVPSKLTAKQRELLEAYAKESGEAPGARKKGFAEKARRFFE